MILIAGVLNVVWGILAVTDADTHATLVQAAALTERVRTLRSELADADAPWMAAHAAKIVEVPVEVPVISERVKEVVREIAVPARAVGGHDCVSLDSAPPALRSPLLCGDHLSLVTPPRGVVRRSSTPW